jgi:formylglycine-generating enzyme
LSCNGKLAPWTASAANSEERPITCVTWFAATAFCIWDGGFLLSESEWNYAASGGDSQRVYPWSVPANSTELECKKANYQGCSASTLRVGQLDKGDGKWGQADLAGNAYEWTADWKNDYSNPCKNCAALTTGDERVVRGGSIDNDAAADLRTSGRNQLKPDQRYYNIGFRCARPPQ